MMSYLIRFHVGIVIWILHKDICYAAKDSSLTTEPTQNVSRISDQGLDQSVFYAVDINIVKSNSRHKRQADEEDVVNQFEIERVSPPYELSYEVPPFGNYIENFWDIKTTNATKGEFFSYYDFEVSDREIVSSQGKNSTPGALPLSDKNKFSSNRTASAEQNDKEHAVIGSGKRSPEKGLLNQYEHHSFSSKFGNYSLIEVHEDDEVHDIEIIPFGERSPLAPWKYDDEHVINRSPVSRLSRGPPADLILLYQQGKNPNTARQGQNGEQKRTFKTDTNVLLVNYQKSVLEHSSKGKKNSTFKSQETGNLNLTLTGGGNFTGKGLVPKKEIYIPFGKRLSTQGGSKLSELKPDVQIISEIHSRNDKIKEKVENTEKVLLQGLSTPQSEPQQPKSTTSKLKKGPVSNIGGMKQSAQEDVEQTTRSPLLRVLGRNRTTQIPVTINFKLRKAEKEIQIPGTGPPVILTNHSAVVVSSSNDKLNKQTSRKGKSQNYNYQHVTESTTKMENQSTFESTPLTVPLVGGIPKRNTRQPKVLIRTSKITLFPSPTIPTVAERSKFSHTVTSTGVPEKPLQGNQTGKEHSLLTKVPPGTVEDVTPSTEPSAPPSLEDILDVHYESLRMTISKPTTIQSISVTEEFAEVTTQLKKQGKSTTLPQFLLQQQKKRTSKNIDDFVSKPTTVVAVQTTTKKPRLSSSVTWKHPPETKKITSRTEKIDRNAKSLDLSEDSSSPKPNIEQTSSTTSPTELITSSPKNGRKIHFEPKRKRRLFHLPPTPVHLDVPFTLSAPTTPSTLSFERPFTVSPSKSAKTAAGLRTSGATTLHPTSPGRERLTTESATAQSVSLEGEIPSTWSKNRGRGSTGRRSKKQKPTRVNSKVPSRSTVSHRNTSTKTYPLSIGVVVSSDTEGNKANLPLLVLISPTKRPGRTLTTPSIGILSTLVSENLTALISAYDDDDYNYDDYSFEDESKDSLPPYKGFLKFYFQPIRKKSRGSKVNRELEVSTSATKITGIH